MEAEKRGYRMLDDESMVSMDDGEINLDPTVCLTIIDMLQRDK